MIIEALVARGGAVWASGKKSPSRKALVLWRSIDDWAALLLRWARSLGHDGSVVTLDEVAEGAGPEGEELRGADAELLTLAARSLQRQGLASVFESGADTGIKFA